MARAAPPPAAAVAAAAFLLLGLAGGAAAANEWGSWLEGPRAALDHYRTVRSITSVSGALHTILYKVAEEKRARGDYEGATRIQGYANSGWTSGWAPVWTPWGAWRAASQVAWAYASSAWFGRPKVSAAQRTVQYAQDLGDILKETAHLATNLDKQQWFNENKEKVNKVSKMLFGDLSSIFQHMGPVGDVVHSVKAELESGNFMGDALRVASADVQKLVNGIQELLGQVQKKAAAYKEEL
eukprot:SM000035S13068  [mRNA]  locus=s35:279195:280477:- [translate_table: standard]